MDRHLLRRTLDDAERRSALVTITAGVGSGKTALLRSWCEEAPRNRFYVDARRDRGWSSRVERILRCGEEVTAVVDGVERLRSQGERERVRCAVARGRGSVVLSGREQPVEPAESARPFVALGAADLAFSSQEAADLLRGRGLPMPPEEILALVHRTEGRAVLLSLAAEVLTRSADPGPTVSALARSSGDVAGALTELLLDTLSAPERDALLALSTVPSFGDGLAAELTGRAGAVTTIAGIGLGYGLLQGTDQPVPGEEIDAIGYRLDETLRRALRARLRQSDVHRVADLHVLASRWYEEAGDAVTGLDQAMRSGAVEPVEGLLRRHGLRLVFSGAIAEVREALAKLEERGVLTPTTALLAALVSSPHMTGSIRVDHFLALADDDTFGQDAATERTVVRQALMALRSEDAGQLNGSLADLAAAESKAAARPNGHGGAESVLHARLFAEVARARVLMRAGHREDALRRAVEVADGAHETKLPWLELVALDLGASAASSLGNWALARALGHRIEAIAQDGSPSGSLVIAAARLRTAEAAYRSCAPYLVSDLNDIVQAHWRALDTVGVLAPRTLLQLFRLDSTEDTRTVFEEMEAIFAMSLRRQPETLAAAAFRFLDLTLRYRGRTIARERLGALAAALGRDTVEYALGAALLHERTLGQEADEAALHAALTDGSVAWHGSNLVHGWLLLAEWSAEAGNEDATLSRLASALALAERMDARRPFLARDGAFARLVEHRLGSFGTMEAFARSAVEAARNAGALDAALATEVRLTSRERVLLLELPLHQSIPEIAEKHHVSANTVKTHLRSIYSKVGANGRADAVQRARDLGLL